MKKWMFAVIVFVIVTTLVFFAWQQQKRSTPTQINNNDVPSTLDITPGGFDGEWHWTLTDIVYTGSCANPANTVIMDLSIKTADNVMLVSGPEGSTGEVRTLEESGDYGFSFLSGEYRYNGAFLIQGNQIRGQFFGDTVSGQCQYNGSFIGVKNNG
jgi:hypothetical protein